MIKSMTGFGRAKCEYEGREYNVEIKSVNHKYSDVSIKIPRQISYLEEKLQSLAEVISDNKAAGAFKLKGGSIVNIRKTSGDLDIFDVLSKISEINDYELQHKCAVLSDIVSDQLKPIIDEINNTKLPNEKNLKKLTLLFETISKTLDNLPSLFSLMKSTLSVGALNTLIIPNLIEISNELKKIKINKTELSKVNDFVSMIGNQINLK